MGFRFRLGPFTFGRTGTRLSLWGGGTGLSIPLSGKGRSFGKISIAPAADPATWTAEEVAAIEAFRSDQPFLERLQQNGCHREACRSASKKTCHVTWVIWTALPIVLCLRQ